MPGVFRILGMRLSVLHLLLFTWAAMAWSPLPAGETRRLTLDEARRELSALHAALAHHDQLYHREAQPEIGDYDYDLLQARRRELEREFPNLAGSAPVLAEIGDDRTGRLQTGRHREPMLSLDKTYAEADLRAFDARLTKLLGRDNLAYVVEPKIDGIAVSVTYERGKLVRAVTRGNGLEGDDITANLAFIRGLRRELRAGVAAGGGAVAIPDLVELRGEIHVTFAEFQRINAEREAAGEAPFAHPRSLAAGTIRLRDPTPPERRELEIAFFGIGACVPAPTAPATQQELHETLQRWGLPGVARFWPARGAEELCAAVAGLGRARAGFRFPTDGAVVKLDEVALQRAAGAGESAPRWAIAYKFAPERVETRVKAIAVQVGRTGVLTPVAELAPVKLAGSIVARATLHNRDEIARRDVRVGDTVVVEKAGEIVPAIVGVNLAKRPAAAQPYLFPDRCPSCDAAVPWQPLEVAVRCRNPACPAQLRRRIEHFASRECMDIPGLGPATIEALVAKGRVKSLADIFRLRREDLLAPGNDVGKSAERLLAAIETSKRTELWRLVYGLGIPQVGAVAAKGIARRAGSLEALLATDVDFGDDAAARAVEAFVGEPRNRALIAALVSAGVQPISTAPVGGEGPLAGKVFVLTGTLATLTRAQATDKIEAAGGKVAGSVSRNAHYVLAGADPGAKSDHARALGVKVIDEAEFLRLVGQ